MSQYDFLTRGGADGRVGVVEDAAGPLVRSVPREIAADPVTRAADVVWREARLAAALPAQAAAVLPLMLALARLQARREFGNRAS